MAETIQRHKRGGLYFEDFEVGKTYEHTLHAHRDADGQHAVLQHDAQSAAAAHRPRTSARPETEWGQPLMNSLFTLGLMIGIQVVGHDGRHHHRQSRHDRCEISQSAV